MVYIAMIAAIVLIAAAGSNAQLQDRARAREVMRIK
jgi:hypothetical protein